MKSITDNVEEESKKTESPSLKEIFRDSIIFPITTLCAKGTLLVTLGTNQGSSNFGLFDYYFIGSMIADMSEVIYRTYCTDELENNNSGTPFSCLERHLLYDLPKKLIRKIK